MKAIPASRTALLAGLVTLASLAWAPSAASAQTDAEREVVSVVERFFQGMLERDSAMIRSTVAPNARLSGAAMRNGTTVFSATSMDQFITAVTTRQGEPANERIYAPQVQIDANLAHVWTFYTLHVGDRFSHCGIDSFQLLKGDDGWKIVNVADTRRTENCDPPGG